MAGTSISDIMEATKLAKGCVYGNFESKEEICNEAFDYLTKKAAEAMDARIASKDTYKDKLFELFEYYRSHLEKSDNYGCPLLNFGTEADDTNPAMRQKVNKGIKASQLRISKLIEGGIKSAEFKRNLDPEQFSIKAYALIQGAMWMSRVQSSSKPLHTAVDSLQNEVETFIR